MANYTDSGEEGAEAPKKNKRNTVGYWLRWIKGARKRSRRHRSDARAAWREYENQPSENRTINYKSLDEYGSKHSYPIYWSSCKVIEPAYYSRTPKTTTIRRFDIDDPVALLGSLVVERLGAVAIEESDFDSLMSAAVGDFIHADKATTQVQYEADIDYVEQRVPVAPAYDGEGMEIEGVWLSPDGSEFSGEVVVDEVSGGFVGVEQVPIPVNQKVFATSCHYDDVLHTPDAKNEGEILDKGFYFNLTKEEATERFGEEVAKRIHYKASSEKKKDGYDQSDEDYAKDDQQTLSPDGEEYVEGWEIWCKHTRRVYWVSDQHESDFLDVKEDPYGLKGFFPAPPFIIGSKPSRSMFPTPAYVQVQAIVKELHKLQNRVFNLIEGIRRRALVDGANEDLIFALNSLEGGEFVAMQNLQQIVEKGGIENLVYWIPVQELVTAIGELQALDEKFKNEFYEWFGIPDILRGASDPVETATSQEIKQSSAHDRFKYAKKQVRILARDTVQMMIDLMLEMYSDEKIMRMVGYEFMAPEEQTLFMPALQMLRDDTERCIRIDIETDSMSFMDEQFRAAQMTQVISTVTGGLQSVAQAAQVNPDFARVGLQTLLMGLEVISPGGKEFQLGVKKAAENLIEQIENPPPPPPPPPDYEMMKLEIASQKNVMEAQSKSRELDRKDYELMIDAQDNATKNMLEKFNSQLDATVQQFMMQMEQQRVQIEQFKAQVQAAESQMEEIRLAKEVDAQTLATLAEVQQPQQQEPIIIPPPVMPPININVESAKPGRRSGSIQYDDFGNANFMLDEPGVEEQVAEAVIADALLNPEG